MGNRVIIIARLGMILGLFSGTQLLSQAILDLPSYPGEKIVLHSDRVFYGVSEEIYYAARCQKPPQIGKLDWSSVLYVELIQWNGTKLAQSKSPIRQGLANGVIKIPKNINSGNYYLRAYTKWMRNYSPYIHTYLPVKIVNPNSTSIDQGPGVGMVSNAVREERAARVSDSIIIGDLQEAYGRRELVKLEIGLLSNQLSGTYTLSVIRQGSQDLSAGSFSFRHQEATSIMRELKFLPETDGLTITGKVIRKSDGEAVSNVKINLSSYSGPFYFSSVTSAADGSFIFIIPRYKGDHEFHVTLESNFDEVHQILITNEFCHQPVNLPFDAFYIDEQEEGMATEIAINAQLTEKFANQDSSGRHLAEIKTPFYGLPGSVTYEKDYIELDNLGELFYEVIHNVNVMTLSQEPYLRVKSASSLVAYPPLVLMDNIPVSNLRSLLETASRRINKIEVVDQGYISGNFKYSGIISIYSENRDMAGVGLTGSSHFFNYQLFAEEDPDFPDHSGSLALSPLADRRNTLYWDPCIELSAEKKITFRFYTSDAPGTYVVQLRMMDTEGSSISSGTAMFTVR